MSHAGAGSQSTNTRLVAIAIAGGLAAAFHMGKIPSALPLVRSDFDLDLFRSGLIVSSFSILAAVGGIALGFLARRLGPRRAGTAGLLTTAIGASLGATSDSYAFLLASRILEGLGFLMVAVTMPGLISRISAPAWKSLALGIWGAFIPAAMSLMLVVAPVAMAHSGWRGLWWLTAVCSCLMAFLFLHYSKTLIPPPQGGPPASKGHSRLNAGPLLITFSFTCYSALFAAVTAFLPTFWHETALVPLAKASLLASLAVTGNIVGNIAAGFLVGRGISLPLLLSVALTGGSVCAALVFSGALPVSGQLLAALGFTTLAGLLPGAVFANIDVIAPSSKSLPLVTGMVFQGAGIGQVIGPAGLSYAVGSSGVWSGGALLIVATGVVGASVALLYGIREHRGRQSR